MMNLNKLTLSGIILDDPIYEYSIKGENFYRTKIAVKRLSGYVDEIPVIISDKLMRDICSGSEVTIHGEWRSRNITKSNDGRKLDLYVFTQKVSYDIVECTNQVELEGYVCKSPVYRTTPLNKEICDILLAVNSGKNHNRSYYLPIITWNRIANWSQYLKVGSKVRLSGRLQSRVYAKTDKNGNVTNHIAYELSVNKINEVDDGAESHI